MMTNLGNICAVTGASGTGAGTVLKLTSADFTGDTYTNALLSGKTPDIQFTLQTDEGSGVLLKVNDGYTFSGSTITATAGDYRLTIYS